MTAPMTRNDSDSALCPAVPSPRPKLIVIDEGRVFAASVREIAEDLGYQVETAVGVGEVMRACSAEPAELVLVGHISPEAHGLDLITWLCKRNSVSRLLFLTDESRRYPDVARLAANQGGRPAVEAHLRPLGANALRAALAGKSPSAMKDEPR